MSPSEQHRFDSEAIEAAAVKKKRLHLQACGKGGKAFVVYHQIMLLDQFERARR